jgi:hypothetical protein
MGEEMGSVANRLNRLWLVYHRHIAMQYTALVLATHERSTLH